MDVLDTLRQSLADRYAIERELGQGGMATVYLARDLKHDRSVALKVLRPELAASLGLDRFLLEIKTTAQLTHPHILPLLDSGGTGAQGHGGADALLYYVMPFVEGESLRDRLSREKQLPLDDALQVTREVADALSYAHSHGVIHRDIKPENILLESGHAVVADFGIARAVAAVGTERLTETGLAVGTPAYMSPEQAAGSQDLDGRSDLYSLGCVLYEMLAGEPPFTGPSAQAVVAKRLSTPAPPVSILRDTVPVGIEAALTRALARTPADRFATTGEFAEALAHPEMMGAMPAAPRPALWRRRAARLAAAVVLLVVIATAVAVGRWLRPSTSGSRHHLTAIAVLPLQNFSAAGPRGYFAGELHDELITQLAKVAALKVIGRTSALAYAGTTKRLSQIGRELAVGSIVEGSVQVEGNRLRVNVQLIDPATEKDLWAEHYDRTLDDVFAVQSEIAQAIVEAVGARLTQAEAGAIAAAPTANAEAYRFYLQGREHFLRPGPWRRNLDSAQQFYERAVALDPSFALAHAALSVVHGYIYFFAYDPSPARAVLQRQAAEAALRLAPTLAQAHMAIGLADYWGRREYHRAMEELRIALRGLPNDAKLWQWIAAVHRRLGNWDEVEAAYERSAQLDPRNADLFADLGGGTYALLHRYPEAVRATDLALSLAPAMTLRGWIYVEWQGRFDTLRAELSRLPRNAEIPGMGNVAANQLQLFLWQRQPDSLLEMLRAARAGAFEQQSSFLPGALYGAWAHQLRGDRPAARAAFDSARVFLDSVLRERPEDWRLHAARGLALAGLLRRADALREAGWLQRSAVYRGDAYDGPVLAEARAQILAQAGDADAALSEIERLLPEPSFVTVHTLRLNPLWDPIRNDARFDALLRRYGG